jgi:transcriptional regulator with XRE-family HTH domain
LSQLQLSVNAGVSTRHLSFIESGRSKPSRDMLLLLAQALDIPLREQNALLHAGGFAEPWSAASFDSRELDSVRRALAFVLERSEPNPCIVVDRHWNVLQTNNAALRLLGWLLDPDALAAIQPLNASRLLFSMALRPHIINWHDAASSFIQRLHREAMSGDPKSAELVKDALSAPGVPSDWRVPNLEAATLPFVPLVLEKNGTRISLFTTITSLGTPLDVTLQELRIESYLPTDDASARALAQLAS